MAFGYRDADGTARTTFVGGAHLAGDSAQSGSMSARLIKLITSVPGVSWLMRKAVDRAYVFGLRKEGYEDVRAPAAAHRGDAPQGEAMESPLRPVRVREIRQETPTARTLVLQDAAKDCPGRLAVTHVLTCRDGRLDTEGNGADSQRRGHATRAHLPHAGAEGRGLRADMRRLSAVEGDARYR